LILIPLVSAGWIFEYNNSIDLKPSCINNGTYCSSSAICNITINYPNGTVQINNDRMTNQGSFHNYTLNDSTILGTYFNTMVCNDNGITGYDTFEFKITGNGREEAGGVVTSLFVIAFIFILIYLIIFLFYGIGHIVELNIGLEDVAYNLGGYFALLGLYMLEKFYLGNLDIEGFLVLFIFIGAITNVFIPLFGFVITLIVGSIKRKKMEEH
jgi:hypothetical protein